MESAQLIENPEKQKARTNANAKEFLVGQSATLTTQVAEASESLFSTAQASTEGAVNTSSATTGVEDLQHAHGGLIELDTSAWHLHDLIGETVGGAFGLILGFAVANRTWRVQGKMIAATKKHIHALQKRRKNYLKQELRTKSAAQTKSDLLDTKLKKEYKEHWLKTNEPHKLKRKDKKADSLHHYRRKSAELKHVETLIEAHFRNPDNPEIKEDLESSIERWKLKKPKKFKNFDGENLMQPLKKQLTDLNQLQTDTEEEKNISGLIDQIEKGEGDKSTNYTELNQNLLEMTGTNFNLQANSEIPIRTAIKTAFNQNKPTQGYRRLKAILELPSIKELEAIKQNVELEKGSAQDAQTKDVAIEKRVDESLEDIEGSIKYESRNLERRSNKTFRAASVCIQTSKALITGAFTTLLLIEGAAHLPALLPIIAVGVTLKKLSLGTAIGYKALITLEKKHSDSERQDPLSKELKTHFSRFRSSQTLADTTTRYAQMMTRAQFETLYEKKKDKKFSAQTIFKDDLEHLPEDRTERENIEKAVRKFEPSLTTTKSKRIKQMQAMLLLEKMKENDPSISETIEKGEEYTSPQFENLQKINALLNKIEEKEIELQTRTKGIKRKGSFWQKTQVMRGKDSEELQEVRAALSAHYENPENANNNVILQEKFETWEKKHPKEFSNHDTSEIEKALTPKVSTPDETAEASTPDTDPDLESLKEELSQLMDQSESETNIQQDAQNFLSKRISSEDFHENCKSKLGINVTTQELDTIENDDQLKPLISDRKRATPLRTRLKNMGHPVADLPPNRSLVALDTFCTATKAGLTSEVY